MYSYGVRVVSGSSPPRATSSPLPHAHPCVLKTMTKIGVGRKVSDFRQVRVCCEAGDVKSRAMPVRRGYPGRAKHRLKDAREGYNLSGQPGNGVRVPSMAR